jgi:hypothetical protein
MPLAASGRIAPAPDLRSQPPQANGLTLSPVAYHDVPAP